MDRRRFLRTAGAFGGATLLGDALMACTPGQATGGVGAEYQPTRLPSGSLLDLLASEAPIDHVVVLMMENRSFDHYLGWLGADQTYLDAGRSRYGKYFGINANNQQTYTGPLGEAESTHHMIGWDYLSNPYRGCDQSDPNHGWTAGRAQRGGVARGALLPGAPGAILRLSDM